METYFKSSAGAIKYIASRGVDTKKVDIISFGNNGCYLFYVDKENNLKKVRLNSMGISYMSQDELSEILQQEGILETSEKDIEKTDLQDIGIILT